MHPILKPLVGGLINSFMENEMRKKACPVCRDSGEDKRTGKPCFYCKKAKAEGEKE